MDRRKFLVGLGSASVGGSALIGSGAFSRVEAQRSVTIEVAEDPDAYLGLDKCRYPDYEGEHVPNGSYAHLDGHGHLEILMNEDNPHHPDDDLGAGVNSDSQTWFHNVFQICNQGKDTVCVHIEEFQTMRNDPEYGPTVDFYLGDDDERSIVGEENHFELEVGDCRCVGIKTVTKGLTEGDELIVDDDITIVADVDCPDDEPECPWLTGQYECTTYESENGNWLRTGTRFRITNEGTLGTDYDLAVANDPDSYRGDLFIEKETNESRIVDASFPKNAIVAWNGCDVVAGPEGDGPEEFIRWGEYKDLRDVDDLDDWYDTYGTGTTSPSGAPSDFNDDRWVSELHIPEFDPDDDPAEDRTGPDEEIDDEDWPCMSEDARDEGWSTCEAHDTDHDCDNGNA